ncbi:hypothetical protein A2U01_0090553, partial [Trifolium medium]|nr:hypothetical protein [Trifolium medium]
MTRKEKGKTVGSPMETKARRVVRVMEEGRRVVAIALSAVKWDIDSLSAQRRKINVL